MSKPTVAIIGLGLIGGSLGMAIKAKKLARRVIGIHYHEGPLAEAKRKKALDEGTTQISKVKDSDLVFICTPISSIVDTARKIAPYLKAEAIITDVGSTKERIVKETEDILKNFVGGHPMAGSEKTGIAAAVANLFKEANWILTPTPKTNAGAIKELREFISNLGAKVILLDPVLHDQEVAAISHLPYAVAVSLVNTLADLKELKDQATALAASGFRDTTRIAAGSVTMGRDILLTNREAVLPMIETFKKSLSRLEEVIRQQNPEALTQELERAKRLREKMWPT